MKLYFYPAVDNNWSTNGNWFTDAAHTSAYTGAPWMADDASKAYDLSFADGIDEGSAYIWINGDIGVAGNAWTVTGTCDMNMGDVNSGANIYSGNFGGTGAGFTINGSIYGGTFSGSDWFNWSYSLGIVGGTFSGSGFINVGYIIGGTFSGSGFSNWSSMNYPGSHGDIQGGTFTGSWATGDTGGTFSGDALTISTANGVVTIAIGSWITIEVPDADLPVQRGINGSGILGLL